MAVGVTPFRCAPRAPGCGPGRPRQNDRQFLSAVCLKAATGASFECLPPGYGNPRSLRTRWQRWQQDGTIARLAPSLAPVVERMERDYRDRILRASLAGSPQHKSAVEFFGYGAIPKLPRLRPRGRYARER